MSKYVYPYSFAEAKNNNELDLWKESKAENIACAKAVENEIKGSFDGSHLDKGCAKNVIQVFGIDRVRLVLAATIQRLSYDGRFSSANRDWARQFDMAYLKEEISNYCISSHPAILDGFIDQAHREYERLNLFEYKHCIPASEAADYKDRVLILRADVLNSDCKAPENQLIIADIGGFGCSPMASGRNVKGHFLIDNEQCSFNRSDFIGIISDEYMPEWAREKLEQMQEEEIEPVIEPAIGDY